MDARGQHMNGGYGLDVWLTQWRRARESESKTFLWSTLRGRYTRNEFETSVDVVVTPPPQGVGGKPMRRRAKMAHPSWRNSSAAFGRDRLASNVWKPLIARSASSS
jgi:hypothetical protein